MPDDDQPLDWVEELRREHEARLVVGQRVKIDIGECRHFLVWHGTIEQGVTGRIVGSYDAGVRQIPKGHRYMVYYDWPLRQRRMWHYAPHELVLIPDATPEEIVAETLRRLDQDRRSERPA